MSGEGGCATASSTAAPCLRLGIYPELTGATLNPAFGTGNLIRTACDPGSTTRCVFLRRYARGMVVVNNSLATKTTGDLSLNLKACRFLFNVYRQRPAGGACVNALNFRIPPMSGRVFRYATTVQGLASLATAP
jgi:hypothetical protein